MAEEILGHGKIVVEVQQDVERELRKAEADFDRAMARLDRKEAELKLDIDDSRFIEKYRKAQADLEKWKHQREANAKIGIDDKNAKLQMANAEARLKRYEGENLKLANRLKTIDEDRARSAQSLADKREAGERKVSNAVARAHEAEAKAAADAEAKKRAEIEKTEAAARKAAAAEAKRAQDTRNRKIKVDLSEAIKQQNELDRAAKQAAADESRAAKQAAADAEKARIAAERQAAADEKAARAATKRSQAVNDRQLKINFKDAIRQQNELERAAKSEADSFDRAYTRKEQNILRYMKLKRQEKSLEGEGKRIFMTPEERQEVKVKVELNKRDLAEVEAELALIGEPPPTVRIDVDADHATGSLAKWASAISDTTVRLGPFTTTIAGAGRAMALLGPVITGIVGALGALVAVAGSAALGLGGALAGGATAFGLAIGTSALLVVPMLGNLKNLNTLQNAYQREALKSGANSKKAQAALKTYNDALSRAPKTTQEVVKGWGDIKKSWGDLSKANEPAFLGALKEGVKTGKDLIQTLGPRISQSFQTIAGGVETAFRALRSKTAKDILGNLFDNANKSMPAFGRGLGNLAEAAGRVASAFSNMLPSLGGGFEKWTQGILNFTRDSGRLTNFVDKTTQSLQKFGHFAQAATRFIATFFSKGVAPGEGMLDNMTNALNRWSDSINNSDSLDKFFGDSVNTTEKLYAALKPLAQTFMEWATLMRPFSDVALQVLGVFLKLQNALVGFKPLKDVFLVLFGAFLAGSIIGKIMGVVGALRTLYTALKAITTVQIAKNLGNALTAGAVPKIARAVSVAESAAPVPARLPTVGRAVEGAAVRGGEDLAIGAAGARAAGGVSKVGAAAGAATREVNVFRAAAEVAIPSIEGMGVIAGGAATAGLGLLAGAAIYGGYKLLTMKSASEKLDDQLKNSGTATKNLITVTDKHSQAVVAMGQSTRAYGQDMGRVSALKKQLNTLEEHGGKNTAAYKMKLDELNQALVSRTQNEKSRDRAQQVALKTDGLAQKFAGDAAKSHDVLTKRISEQRDKQDRLNQAIDMYGKGSAEAKRAQMDLDDAVSKTTTAQNAYNSASSAAAHYARQKVVDELNYKRALEGLIPIAGKAGTAMAKLASRAPNLTQTIALKYADPKDAGAVASRASAALAAGVKSSVVLKIIADSKNADQAIRRLRAVSLDPKEQRIIESGGKKALSMIESIIGRKLSAKEQRIVEHGGISVLQMLGNILGIKIPNKNTHVAQTGADAVRNAISQVLGLLDSMPASKTTRINTVYTKTMITKRSGGAAMGGIVTPEEKTPAFATGGVSDNPTLDKRMEWAAGPASPNTVSTKGGKYSRPTYLVGEENRSEYVIATNPAYKQRNVTFLSQAAQHLGYDLAPRGASQRVLSGKDGTTADPNKQRGTVIRTPKGDVEAAALGKGGLVTGSSGITFGSVTTGSGMKTNLNTSTVGKNRPPTPSKAKSLVRPSTQFNKKQKKAFKTERSWATYIDDLKTQQGYAEQEVQLREAAVREPADMVIQTGTQSVVDPTTGESVDVPVYAANPKIESEYKPDLSAVSKAYDMLVAIVQELITSIPKAITANIEERTIRNAAVKQAKHEIRKENNRWKGKSDKQKKAGQKAHDDRLDKLKNVITDNEQISGTLKDDEKTLQGDFVQAGFDIRTDRAAAAAVKTEYDTAEGDAEGSATTQTTEASDAVTQQKPSTSDSGAAGSTSDSGATGPTLQQQTGMADTERANILRQYGGNMGAVTNSGAAGAAQGGMQANTAAGNPLAAIGSAITTAAASSVTALSDSSVARMASSLSTPAQTSAAAPVTSGTAVAADGGTTNKTVNITNNFATAPADPHSWSAGVAYETNALV